MYVLAFVASVFSNVHVQTPPLSLLTQVTFYTRESVASNHAVREAACTCIAELGSKVSSDCLRPHVPHLRDIKYSYT